MGLKVNARDAARLVDRTERTVRAWVASGKLHAEPAGVRTKRRGVGPSRWLIDTDELAAMPGVRLDGALMAELQSRSVLVGGGENILVRLERIERNLAEVQQWVRELREKDAEDNTPGKETP